MHAPRTVGTALAPLAAVLITVVLAACSAASPTGSSGTAGSGGTGGAGATPGASAGTGVVLTPAQLRLAIIDRFGPPWWCDPDFFPIARSDEEARAVERFA